MPEFFTSEMAETTKSTEDPYFKGGVMSPNSKRTFSEMRYAPPPVPPKQKLILDELSFEQCFLRCVICKEKYDMKLRSPRLLPCHHTFCLSCILAIYERQEYHRQSLAPISTDDSTSMAIALQVSCPNCGGSFISTLAGLKELTTDHRIVQLMDFVGHTDKQVVTFCPNHALQPLNFFCEKCVQPICRDCTVLDHKECSKEEAVIDLTKAKEKYAPTLDEGVTKLAEETKSLAEKKADCQKALESCQEGDDSLTKSIKEMFDKIRKALNEREQEILDMTNSNPAKSKESIEAKLNKLSEKEKEVEGIKQEIKKAKNADTVQEMFLVYKKIREYQTEPGVSKEDLEKDDQPTSTFVARDESTLLHRISNFGEIKSSQTNGFSSSSNYSPYLSTTPRYTSYTPSSYSSRYSTRSYKY